MKRFLLAAVVVAGASLAGACNKPSNDDCRAAIAKMEALLGAEMNTARTAESEGEVRRCRGGSTQEAVACAIKANTKDELKACDFMASKGQKK
jgi:hypothetical protein